MKRLSLLVFAVLWTAFVLWLPVDAADQYVISCNDKTCEIGKEDLRQLRDRLNRAESRVLLLEGRVGKTCL